jgi:cytochrome c oxidase subunit 3/cytochrome o ubiquinol oxidase subunit 3
MNDEHLMAATATQTLPPPPIPVERNLSPAQWGMIAFLVSEVAFFSTLIVTYVAFMGADTVGPTPAEALSLPLVIGTTICLVTSSFVIHAAEMALARGRGGMFRALWMATIALGVAFLAGTAVEWHELVFEKNLTISRNLFGTTYYTLVGFHALHVTGGVVAMLVVFIVTWRRAISSAVGAGVELVGWYWHFVDAVWIVVFLVVYVASRGGAA